MMTMQNTEKQNALEQTKPKQHFSLWKPAAILQTYSKPTKAT